MKNKLLLLLILLLLNCNIVYCIENKELYRNPDMVYDIIYNNYDFKTQLYIWYYIEYSFYLEAKKYGLSWEDAKEMRRKYFELHE